MKLNEKQMTILEILARFKYLTSWQLQLIMKLKSTSSINTAIRQMNQGKWPLVKSLGFGIVPGYGKLPKVHYLTNAGKRFLVEELKYREAMIQYPKNRNSFFRRDYFHRVSTVNFNIRFQNWLANSNYGYLFFHPYFNHKKAKSGWCSMTAAAIGDWRMEPDGIGLYMAMGQARLVLFEQHNGHDAKRAIKQMKHHCLALSKGTYSDRYGLKTSTKVIYLFEHDSCMRSVMNKFVQHKGLMKFKNHFIFKSNDELEKGFFYDWHTPTDRLVTVME